MLNTLLTHFPKHILLPTSYLCVSEYHAQSGMYVDDVLIWEGDQKDREKFIEEVNGREHRIQIKKEIGDKYLNYLSV